MPPKRSMVSSNRTSPSKRKRVTLIDPAGTPEPRATDASSKRPYLILLPPDIRAMIWDRVYKKAKRVIEVNDGKAKLKTTQPARNLLALPLIRKKITSEALHALYSRTAFVFTHFVAVTAFVAQLSVKANILDTITSLEIRAFIPVNGADIAGALSKLPNLSSLQLTLYGQMVSVIASQLAMAYHSIHDPVSRHIASLNEFHRDLHIARKKKGISSLVAIRVTLPWFPQLARKAERDLWQANVGASLPYKVEEAQNEWVRELDELAFITQCRQ
ncbi:Histone acetyltransferase rtt109 [Sphaceloma murrayae]|uniref:Histone acetyltransferase rtt109 n=1 Tax=Sphaceloma murrayae TaxID=2082308 RepID=A0A2K1QK91_9PEZI|nr:Histone acetyltransferase rtt109 [Sphaceloma murrayae]